MVRAGTTVLNKCRAWSIKPVFQFFNKIKRTSHSQISFCIRSSEVRHCRRPNSCLAVMSIMDCVIRQPFSASFTSVIDESENQPFAGGLEHDIETPWPSTLVDIAVVGRTRWNPQYDHSQPNWEHRFDTNVEYYVASSLTIDDSRFNDKQLT